MRIAILADIHGNPIALEAALVDIQNRGGVDAYWMLGDLCAIGYDPVSVMQQINALPECICIRGNTDRFLVTGERPAPHLAEVEQNPALISLYAEVEGSFAWTQGYLEAHGLLAKLASLPPEAVMQFPGGQRVLLTHAVPGLDDGEGLNPSLSEADFVAVVGDCEADLICVGHFHMAMDRSHAAQRVINPGSISNAFAPDLRAGYAILQTTVNSITIKWHKVDYDRQAVIKKTLQSSNPGANYIAAFIRGEVRAPWLQKWDGQSFYPPISP